MSKKMRLELSELAVETFSTDKIPESGGTVRAHEPAAGNNPVIDTLASALLPLGCIGSLAGCSIAWTCPQSCGITCPQTCTPTCTCSYTCDNCTGSGRCTQITYCTNQDFEQHNSPLNSGA